MIYQACSSPGIYPRQHKAILMTESAVHKPTLIHTIDGALASYLSEAKISDGVKLKHTCNGWEEDSQDSQENVCATHCYSLFFLLSSFFFLSILLYLPTKTENSGMGRVVVTAMVNGRCLARGRCT